ncbi:MAG: hypothetical protein M3275_13960 [Thermoproteota archaeon]|nr:hypothetical protein [Thermoproteota archaeon]
MLPNWLEKRYRTLREAHGDSTFHFEDAAKVLKKEKMQDSEDQINIFLSELRKRKLLKVEFDSEDARKRIYKLESRVQIISEKVLKDKKQLTRSDLETLLKGILGDNIKGIYQLSRLRKGSIHILV